MTKNPPSVYLPSNEPYLGRITLFKFDLEIVEALKVNRELADASFKAGRSQLQDAAAEIIPQIVSIVLSMRELLRQGYLFSAVVLMRPTLERLALVIYLRDFPDKVTAWHNGWPRKDQPSFDSLISHLIPAINSKLNASQKKQLLSRLHKVVHPDPYAAFWNRTERDGKAAFASGKLLDSPKTCDFCAEFGRWSLFQSMNIASTIFEEVSK
jgi:hypothetical protein